MTTITDLYSKNKPLMAIYFQEMINGEFPNPKPGKTKPITYKSNLKIAKLTTNKFSLYQVMINDVSPVEGEIITSLSGPYRPDDKIFQSALDLHLNNYINESSIPVLVLAKDRFIENRRYMINTVFDEGSKYGYFAALPLNLINPLSRPEYVKKETYADEHPGI